MRALCLPVAAFLAACGPGETLLNHPAQNTGGGAGGGGQVTIAAPQPVAALPTELAGHFEPVARVPPVVYPSPDWPTGTPQANGLDPAALENAATAASTNGSYCLLVIRHGQLVFERYFNSATAAQTHSSWSIAKSYSSILAGIALDRGEFQSLDQSVADFVPAWKGTPREAITLRHLLTMTSGLKWSAIDDYVGMATFASNHTEFAIKQPLADAPGSKWTYDNEAVQVLEAVFRAATGMTVEAYAQLHLWSALGMTATWKHDPSGNPTTYANVLASCRDHAKLGYLLLHHGQWAGQQVVSQSYLSLALNPSQAMNRAYGHLFWLNGQAPAMDAMMQAWPGQMVPYAPADLFAARGFGNQFIDVIPSMDLIVVRFGTDPMANFDLGQLAIDARFTKHDDILKPLLLGVAP